MKKVLDPKASELVFELKLLGNKNTKEMGGKKSLGDRVEVVIKYRYCVKLFVNCIKSKVSRIFRVVF